MRTPATSMTTSTARVPPSTTASPAPSPSLAGLPANAGDAGVIPAVPTEPAALGDQLARAEQTVRSGSGLAPAARTAQAAYRAWMRHPEWDATVLGRLPAALHATARANLTALREIDAIKYEQPQPTIPAWRIIAPAPQQQLLSWYREAEQRYGVPWVYLAAINHIESSLGRVSGDSAAGAQGPMQFLPATWADYGEGGDINDPHDSILAAGRYLARNGMPGDVDGAIHAYNPTPHYVAAVNALAGVLRTDAQALSGYYHWDVYYETTSGWVMLPVGFAASTRTPAADYVRRYPQRVAQA